MQCIIRLNIREEAIYPARSATLFINKPDVIPRDIDFTEGRVC
jgi:hypothetical protein